MTYRAYKYRLWPTHEQCMQLEQVFAAVRWVYNAALEQRKTYGRAKGTDPFGRDSAFSAPKQARELNFRDKPGRPGLTNDTDLSWLTAAPRECFDNALRDLDKAFDNFFAGRAGFPSFRRADRNNSLSLKVFSFARNDKGYRVNVLFGRNCVTLPKLGRIEYNRHRKFYGAPKTVEVVREGAEYYVILVTEQVAKKIDHPEDSVGIDLGVNRPVTLSTGEFIGRDTGQFALDQKARKAQRKLSRKKKGSVRREKQKRKLAAIRRKQARRRTAFAHRITTEVTRRFKTIAIEDLRVSNMTASAKGDKENPGTNVKAKAGLNREILNASPYLIRQQLTYKADMAGGKVIAVDPKYTSQTCSDCGFTNKENRKSQSEFVCLACGHTENADVNAALNIQFRAITPAGAPVRRKTPSEFHQKPATSKGIVSCFQPPSTHNSADETVVCP